MVKKKASSVRCLTYSRPVKKKKALHFAPSRFCVDAGNVSIVDKAYIKENGGDLDGFETVSIALKPGRYRVQLFAPKTWFGPRQVTKVITVKGDGLIVGDICYSFSDLEQGLWEGFVKATKCFKNLRGRGASLDTGGDGIFEVEVFVDEL